MRTLFLKFILFCLMATLSHLAAEQRFIVVTPEKTGTHLLTKAIERLIDKGTRNCWEYELPESLLLGELNEAERSNCFLQMHALPTREMIGILKKHGYKVIFLMRDPRDVVISALHAIEKGWAYGPYSLERGGYASLSLKKRRTELISGSSFGLIVPQDIIGRRIPWMKEDPDFVCTVYFENLVGPEGCGNAEAQRQEIVKIANHIGVPLDEQRLSYVLRDLFGVPEEKTFRQGKIGAWRKEFSEEDIWQFKRVFGSELIYLRYETTLNWTRRP
jgi:hypothetical protein